MCFSKSTYKTTNKRQRINGLSIVLFRLNGLTWVMVWHACWFVCSEMIAEGTTSIMCSYLRIWPYTHFGLTRALRHDFSLHGQTIFCPTATIITLPAQRAGYYIATVSSSFFFFLLLLILPAQPQDLILLQFLLLLLLLLLSSSSSFCQHRYFSYSLHGMTMWLRLYSLAWWPLQNLWV